MSATRDKGQQFKFVYSNLHKIYKTGKGHEEVIAVLTKPKQTPIEDLKQDLSKLKDLNCKLKALLLELEKLAK